MSLIGIFDRLLSAPVNRIIFRDGSELRCPTSMTVDFVDSQNDALAQAWIEVSQEGLVLHFNADLISRTVSTGLTAQTEPLVNILQVS